MTPATVRRAALVDQRKSVNSRNAVSTAPCCPSPWWWRSSAATSQWWVECRPRTPRRASSCQSSSTLAACHASAKSSAHHPVALLECKAHQRAGCCRGRLFHRTVRPGLPVIRAVHYEQTIGRYRCLLKEVDGKFSTPASLLLTLLTERALRLMAGAASFERGERYATTRRVKKLKVTESELSATVTGTRSYQVRIWAEEGSLSYSCSCPMGDDEVFCKHCVATGLVWLGAVADKGRRTTAGYRRALRGDVRAYLLSRDKETLVELLMERAATDELFDAKLALEAAKASSLHADLEPYRQAIEAAIVVDDFVDYRSMYDYSCNVQAAIGAIEELLENEQAADVIDLCEYALECVEDATGRVDDSDGQMGDIREQLIELHHRACLEARPSSEELAERLFDWAIHSDWETLIDGAERYADVLGEAGLARYRALAEEVWDHVPELANANREDHTGSRFRITYIMEALAKLFGLGGGAGRHQGTRSHLRLSLRSDRGALGRSRTLRGGA